MIPLLAGLTAGIHLVLYINTEDLLLPFGEGVLGTFLKTLLLSLYGTS
jgi:hypothetical protein